MADRGGGELTDPATASDRIALRREGPVLTPKRGAFVAATAGFAVMSVELTAVRVMAPHFGDSAYVWTNVIGVILVALALGAWLGGRASERGVRLYAMLIVAGALVMISPYLADPLGSWLLPHDLALDQASGALVRGSLAATVILFAPPTLFAGMATPLLVSALAQGMGVGRASGHIAAWSTLGSLAGTFATTHLLVPTLGSQWTLSVCGALLILAACFTGRVPYAGLTAGAALLSSMTGFAGYSWSSTKSRLPVGDRVLYEEVDSAYQYLRVVTGDGETLLQINEGLDSFHSVALDDTPFTGGRYYDWFAAVPFLRELDQPRASEPMRVLSLGAAAGTFERLLDAVRPGTVFDSVELDPKVVELSEAYFGGFPDNAKVYTGIDGRVFAAQTEETYDVILVDAYERQVYIPVQLASREFFAIAQERLESGGIIAVNAGGRTFDDPVIKVVASTMADVFGAAWAFRVPQSRNFMILARRDGEIEPARLDKSASLVPEIATVLDTASRPFHWRRFESSPPILTDDRPFLDQTQDAALARSMDGGALLAFDGASAPDVVESQAHAALQVGDIDGLGAALARASAATPLLRLYAGDWRWFVHDLRGAEREYAAGLAIVKDAAIKAQLEQRHASAVDEVAKLDRAAGVTGRNGWLAALTMSGLVAAFWLSYRRIAAPAVA